MRAKTDDPRRLPVARSGGSKRFGRRERCGQCGCAPARRRECPFAFVGTSASSAARRRDRPSTKLGAVARPRSDPQGIGSLEQERRSGVSESCCGGWRRARFPSGARSRPGLEAEARAPPLIECTARNTVLTISGSRSPCFSAKSAVSNSPSRSSHSWKKPALISAKTSGGSHGSCSHHAVTRRIAVRQFVGVERLHDPARGARAARAILELRVGFVVSTRIGVACGGPCRAPAR